MSESTPTENLNDPDNPDGPGWRTLGEREVLQPGDMWRDLEGNWRETNYGNDNVLAGNTAADYYRRRIEIPEPAPVQLPEVSRMSLNDLGYEQTVSTANGTLSFEVPLTIEPTISQLQEYIRDWAIRKGWLTETPRNPAEQLMLIVTELAEACEAFRVGNPPCERPGMEQYSHAAEELADVVIRCLQMAGEHNIPLADVVMAKMAFNETRPVKHGKKF